MSFETVLEQAQNADVWVGPAQFTSYEEMLKSNPNYQYFKAFQNKKIYSFSSKKGVTGGVIYYEEASSRPDLVLKDLVKILHPDLIPNHQLYFFEALK
jgi:iron complex transport system substrate-binding protein